MSPKRSGAQSASGATPIVVRPAIGDDLEGVVNVGRTTWQTTYTSILPPELLELFLAKWWTKDANIPAIRGRRTFVADRGGRIVGMASYGTHEGRLIVWKIYVLDEAQGQGVGGRLLEAVYERASEGHDSVYLSFTDGNAAAYDFARSHGYVEDHREAQSGLPDLIWMRHDFADPGPAEGRASGTGEESVGSA